jgi:hypothetical protein
VEAGLSDVLRERLREVRASGESRVELRGQ